MVKLNEQKRLYEEHHLAHAQQHSAEQPALFEEELRKISLHSVHLRSALATQMHASVALKQDLDSAEHTVLELQASLETRQADLHLIIGQHHAMTQQWINTRDALRQAKVENEHKLQVGRQNQAAYEMKRDAVEDLKGVESALLVTLESLKVNQRARKRLAIQPVVVQQRRHTFQVQQQSTNDVGDNDDYVIW